MADCRRVRMRAIVRFLRQPEVGRVHAMSAACKSRAYRMQRWGARLSLHKLSP